MQKVINTYLETEQYYILKITNTKNITAEVLIDKDDYTYVKEYRWTLSIHDTDIRVIALSKELNRCYLHQFLIKEVNNNCVIDHIDRNPLNNRRNNLRTVSRSVNSTNAKPRLESKTKIRGVYYRQARKGISADSWVCEWSEEGKRYSKSFSIKKYGEKQAFLYACELRKMKLKEMKI